MIRRAWAVLADPPASDDAALLRVVIPIVAAFYAAYLAGWWLLPGSLGELLLLYVLLAAVRQRDQVRADYAVLRRNARIVAAAYLSRGDG